MPKTSTNLRFWITSRMLVTIVRTTNSLTSISHLIITENPTWHCSTSRPCSRPATLATSRRGTANSSFWVSSVTAFWSLFGQPEADVLEDFWARLIRVTPCKNMPKATSPFYNCWLKGNPCSDFCHRRLTKTWARITEILLLTQLPDILPLTNTCIPHIKCKTCIFLTMRLMPIFQEISTLRWKGRQSLLDLQG